MTDQKSWDTIHTFTEIILQRKKINLDNAEIETVSGNPNNGLRCIKENLINEKYGPPPRSNAKGS